MVSPLESMLMPFGLFSSGGFDLFLADLNAQRGSHRYKNQKLVTDTSCTSNCGPVVTLLLKSLFELLELR